MKTEQLIILIHLFKFKGIEENNGDDEEHLKENTHEQSSLS
ncbi:hypothetical protein [Alkalibacillus haloalkaliphilus]|nr:hypothetical protein [Alkalibacillus haloalkaliphilus]